MKIISSNRVGIKEKNTRIELLKNLAYRHEMIPIKEILAQYASFLSKIEKGKYKWGSKKDLANFEKQLMYSMSVERVKPESEKVVNKSKVKASGREEKKKYCLDYNVGTCVRDSPHEGQLKGNVVLKYHVCKKCLMDHNLERYHPSKECNGHGK